MNRRNFLKSALILTAAPAIVRAESLMPVRQLILPERELVLPEMGIQLDVRPDIEVPSLESITVAQYASLCLNDKNMWEQCPSYMRVPVSEAMRRIAGRPTHGRLVA